MSYNATIKATRIGIAQHDAQRQMGADTISHCTAIGACKHGRECQLALGLLSTVVPARMELDWTRVATRTGLDQRG